MYYDRLLDSFRFFLRFGIQIWNALACEPNLWSEPKQILDLKTPKRADEDGQLTDNWRPQLELGYFSTDEVVRTFPEAFDQVLSHHRKIIALDMEAYNFYNACHHTLNVKFPFILAKAVTDYADETKTKVFQPYGARLAALYLLELIGIYLDTLITLVGERSLPVAVMFLQLIARIALDNVAEDQSTPDSGGNAPIRDERDRRCLEDLNVSDPRDDKKRIEWINGGLLDKSYLWILENTDFRQWRDEQASQLLWIKGDPGKGKTMLLCGIIDDLQRSAAKTGLLAFFFCQATDSRLNTFTAVLRGLIYLLLDQQPSLIRHVRNRYDLAGKALFKDPNAWVALSDILSNILQDRQLPTIFLIIDALDECLTDLPQLLGFIAKNSVASHSIKWLVSSRNRPDIEEGLDGAGRRVRLCLESNAKSVSNAVSNYIEHQVDELANVKKYDSNTATAVRTYLSSNANDTFLWAASVCQHLKKTSAINTIQKLETFPRGLDPLYERMIKQVFDSDDAEVCKRVLAVVTIVYRPISVGELTSLTKLTGITSDGLASWEQVVELCASFLTIRKGTVYFVHQSAKDFLLNKASAQLFPHGVEEVHHAVFLTSLEAMSRTLRRDIYNLGSPVFAIAGVKPPLFDPLAMIRYSCIYWVDHLYDASKNVKRHSDLGDQGTVHHFLRGKCLYWLEGLSILRSIPKGILAMSRLEGLIQRETHESPETYRSELMMNLVRDTRRFILYFRAAIEHSPLQVYVSGSVFSPARSSIRELFEDQEPGWIATKPVMQDLWDACLQTLEGHRRLVHSLAFSHDSRCIATASYDNTVKIWDTGSGQCSQTLEGHHDCITSIAFLHDSKSLALASRDGTIGIWDTSRGRCIQSLKGHSDWVNSVAFSHDSKYLASASRDKTVKIWDTSRGRCIYTLEGHSDEVTSVVFSHDSKSLASTSRDKTVKTWDTSSGRCIHTLGGHFGAVISVAFSHDSMSLVLASKNRTVKILDIGNGQCTPLLQEHLGGVNSMAFSYDSKYLASASYDRTVKIWDTGSGQCLHTLEEHLGGVNSMAFSYDSKYLASASYDRTVKIWDTRSGRCIQTLITDIETPLNISFDHSNAGGHTKSGDAVLYKSSLTMDSAPADAVHQISIRQGYGISSDKTWILWNSKNMLWLPPEYRPLSWTMRELSLCIGCDSGRVLIFRFVGQPSSDQRSSTSSIGVTVSSSAPTSRRDHPGTSLPGLVADS